MNLIIVIFLIIVILTYIRKDIFILFYFLKNMKLNKMRKIRETYAFSINNSVIFSLLKIQWNNLQQKKVVHVAAGPCKLET